MMFEAGLCLECFSLCLQYAVYFYIAASGGLFLQLKIWPRESHLCRENLVLVKLCSMQVRYFEIFLGVCFYLLILLGQDC